VPLADRNLVDGQNAQSFVPGLAVLLLQKEFVDVLYGLPVQAEVLGHLFDRHDLAEFVDIVGHAESHPQVGMKKFQAFDDNALTVQAKDLAILAMEPDSCRGHIQIPNLSLDPAVNIPRSLATEVTTGQKAPVGNHLDSSLSTSEIHGLIDNSDSTKGEVGCYTDCGHRWPPWDNFLAHTQVYYLLEMPDVHYALKF